MYIFTDIHVRIYQCMYVCTYIIYIDKITPSLTGPELTQPNMKRIDLLYCGIMDYTWACEKFSDYILGCKFHIESDHKPLILILSTKHLDHLPPRALRFRLRLARFDFTIQHTPGKLLYAADALSRAPLAEKGVTPIPGGGRNLH